MTTRGKNPLRGLLEGKNPHSGIEKTRHHTKGILPCTQENIMQLPSPCKVHAMNSYELRKLLVNHV